MTERELTGTQLVATEEYPIAPQMSVGEWIITILILTIPIVNFIMLFIWAFDATSGRRNFSRAYLIIFGAMLALMIVFFIFMFVLGISIGVLTS